MMLIPLPPIPIITICIYMEEEVGRFHWKIFGDWIWDLGNGKNLKHLNQEEALTGLLIYKNIRWSTLREGFMSLEERSVLATERTRLHFGFIVLM
jgi:hypothetical protein